MTILKNQKGTLMIESVVALSLVVIGLLGIIALINQSLEYDRLVANRFVATYLAAEGIEIIKSAIDAIILKEGKSWDTLQSTDLPPGYYKVTYDMYASDLSKTNSPDTSHYIYFSSTTGIYYDPRAVSEATTRSGYVKTPFVRNVEVRYVSADEIKVISTVTWKRFPNSYSVSLEDHFFRWRK